MKTSDRWRARWQAFLQPIDLEKAHILRERWDSLPRELQTDNQISGRHLTHCGFTLGASYCSFHCTHCYLPKNANGVPIPSFAQMKEQIDANRRFQGPGGGLQITGGDVADAYWRAGRRRRTGKNRPLRLFRWPRPDAHDARADADRASGISRAPRVEGGLRQVSVHIDMTQAGRHGYPIRRVKSEADLHPVRQAFTDLAQHVARKPAPRSNSRSAPPSRATQYRRRAGDHPLVSRRSGALAHLADDQVSTRSRHRTHDFFRASDHPRARLGKNLRRRRAPICAATSRFSGIPIAIHWASLLVARPSGKYFALLPDDKKFDPLLRPSPRQDRRLVPRQRRRRHPALQTDRRPRAPSASAQRGVYRLART